MQEILRSVECLQFVLLFPLYLILSYIIIILYYPELKPQLFFIFWDFWILYDVIPCTPDMAFSLDDFHAGGTVIHFVKQGLFFSELSTSSLLLDPYFGSTFCCKTSLFLLNIYASPIRSLANGRTDSVSPSVFPFSRNIFVLWDFKCYDHLWVFTCLWGRSVSLGHLL